MPSSATITTFYTFVPATIIRSAQVNNNFDVFRGHLLPVDPSTSTAGVTRTWDLGSTDHMWQNAYLGRATFYQNTAGSIPTPPAGMMYLYFNEDGKGYVKNPAGVQSAVGGGQLVVTGTRAAPSTITAAGGIAYVPSAGGRQKWFVTSAFADGNPIELSANPQIVASDEDGKELFISGALDNAPLQLNDGNGLKLNGSIVLNAYTILGLQWDAGASLWVETGRNNL